MAIGRVLEKQVHCIKVGLTAFMMTKHLAMQDDEEDEDEEDDEDEDEGDELARRDSGIIITELNHDGSEKLTDVSPLLCVMSMETSHCSFAAAT